MTYSEATKERLRLAKEVPLTGLIKELGYQLTDTGSYLTMLSPFRSESVGSLFIDKRKPWRFKDYGNGVRGDVIEFVQQLFGYTKKQAIDYLLGKRNVPLPDYPPIKREKKAVDVVSIQPYREGICPELDSYLQSRYICPRIASIYLYLAEIKFPYSKYDPEKIHSVFAFKNDSGGYEFRSKRFKIGNSPKNITTIKFDDGQTTYIFEGWPDFLTFLMERDVEGIRLGLGKVIVLNSISFLSAIAPMFSNTIVCYIGHNDKAGNEGLDTLRNYCRCVMDYRNVYYPKKDLNDWWIAKNKKKGYLSDILKI